MVFLLHGLRRIALSLTVALLLWNFIKELDPFLLHLDGRIGVRGIIWISIFQLPWTVAVLVKIRADKRLKPFFDFCPEIVDNLHVCTLYQNALKHIKSVLILDQNFERLCVIQLLRVFNDSLLVLVIYDLFNHIWWELLYRQLLELGLQVLENIFTLFNGPIVESYLKRVISISVLSKTYSIITQLLIDDFLQLRCPDPSQALLD